VITYQNPYPVAFPYEKYLPLPGNGFTPNLAGPARLGVGDTGIGTSLLIGSVLYFALASAAGYWAAKKAAEVTGQKRKTAQTWAIAGAVVTPIALMLLPSSSPGA